MDHAETAECNCEHHCCCAGVRDWFGKKQSNRSDAAIRKVVARAHLRKCELASARTADEVEVDTASEVECRVSRCSRGVVNYGLAISSRIERSVEICVESCN